MRRIETLAIVAGLAIVVAACSNPAASSVAPSSAPSVAPATSAPASEAPSSAPATAMKVGYISLGEAIPFVSLVTNSIKDEAAKVPGLEIVVCDSEIDAAKALACAQNLKVQNVQAVLNFQLYEDSSPEVCTAYGDLPTIAIDIHQAPCEVAFMGADNTLAGTLAGKAVGDALKAENDCTYEAVVTLDTKGAGATTLARMDGMIAGFEEACGTIDAGQVQEHRRRRHDRPRPREVRKPAVGHQAGRHHRHPQPERRHVARGLRRRPHRGSREGDSASPARVPIRPPGRRSPATRSGWPTRPTSRSDTARSSSRPWSTCSAGRRSRRTCSPSTRPSPRTTSGPLYPDTPAC